MGHHDRRGGRVRTPDATQDADGQEYVRQYRVLTRHRREQIYNVPGNHNAPYFDTDQVLVSKMVQPPRREHGVFRRRCAAETVFRSMERGSVIDFGRAISYF